MDATLFLSAFQITLKLLSYPLAAICFGGIIMALLRLWTQLDEAALSFVGRIAALVLFFVFASDGYFRPVVEFAEQTWGKAAYSELP